MENEISWEGYNNMESKVDISGMIKNCLRKLEKEKGIKIVIASDTGSRSCNIHSFNSDFDIHFIFVVSDLNSYFSIVNLPETLTINDAFKLEDGSSVEINCSGWEIKKACQLMATSNAAMVELVSHSLLHSNRVLSDYPNPFLIKSDDNGGEYEVSLQTQEKRLLTRLSFLKLGFHYRSTAFTVFKKKIQTEDKTTATKNYLNAIRYINLAQQLADTMKDTCCEYNDYSLVDPLDLSHLPHDLCEAQGDLVSKRRSRVWNVKRDPNLEQSLEKSLDQLLEFFKNFKESKQLEKNIASDYQTKLLFERCNRISIQAIRSVLTLE